MRPFPNITWTGRTIGLSALVVLVLGLVPADAHPHRRHNPPGPRGGPGANWVRPLSPAGIAAASRYRRAFRSTPPGPRGGRGTNWANPPGPVGGPGASPFRLRRW